MIYTFVEEFKERKGWLPTNFKLFDSVPEKTKHILFISSRCQIKPCLGIPPKSSLPEEFRTRWFHSFNYFEPEELFNFNYAQRMVKDRALVNNSTRSIIIRGETRVYFRQNYFKILNGKGYFSELERLRKFAKGKRLRVIVFTSADAEDLKIF